MKRNRFAIAAAILIATAATISAQPATRFGEGTHLVGTDIQPGVYRTEGEVRYFARLSGVSGEFGDIIANETPDDGPVLVEIKEGDVAFESNGDGEWYLLDDSYQPEQQTSFGPGWWLVGKDIKPGLYRSEVGISYHERLSGVGGELGDILANEAFSDGPIVVEIKSGDVAFHSSGEGYWSIVDDSYRPELRTIFGDGFWIVGVDIMPGLYQTTDDVSYYARLSGFGGQLGDIIANEAGASGRSTIEIKATDVGFQTQGGATWSRVDTSPTLVRSATWGHVKSQLSR